MYSSCDKLSICDTRIHVLVGTLLLIGSIVYRWTLCRVFSIKFEIISNWGKPIWNLCGKQNG